MATSEMLTTVGLLVAVLGWFVASVLRLHEAQRANRHQIYAALLGPAAQMLAALSLGRTEDEATWRRSRQPDFEKCFVELVAAVGAVELVRKSKVSWSAQQLRRTLQEALALGRGAGSCTCPFEDRVAQHRLKALAARDDFILIAGRSLEGWPRRPIRDRTTKRRDAVRRIDKEVTAFQQALEARRDAWAQLIGVHDGGRCPDAKASAVPEARTAAEV